MVVLSTNGLIATALFLIIGLIVSSIIIYAVTYLFHERKGYGTALVTALVGSIIYAIAFFFLGHGLLAAIIGGFFWLLALRHFYRMGWLKALAVALVVWIFAVVVGFFIPAGIGPL